MHIYYNYIYLYYRCRYFLSVRHAAYRTEASWWNGTLVLRSRTCCLRMSPSPRESDELSLKVATLTFLRLSLTLEIRNLHRSLRDWKDHVVSMCADICLAHGVPVYKLSQLHRSTVWQKVHSRLEACNPLSLFAIHGNSICIRINSLHGIAKTQLRLFCKRVFV